MAETLRFGRDQTHRPEMPQHGCLGLHMFFFIADQDYPRRIIHMLMLDGFAYRARPNRS
jgi:hypothetical protein